MPTGQRATLPARRRGRPRKFSTPSRPVTVTLPDEVLDALGAIDADIGRAIVRLAQPEIGRRPHEPAELATFGRHAVIVVNRSRALESRTGVELIPLPDGRALISFEQPMSIADLELVLADAVEDTRLSTRDRAVFQGIADTLRDARRSVDVTLQQRSIIVLESKRRPAAWKKPSQRRLHS